MILNRFPIVCFTTAFEPRMPLSTPRVKVEAGPGRNAHVQNLNVTTSKPTAITRPTLLNVATTSSPRSQPGSECPFGLSPASPDV